jgi:hypothetical protein
MIRLEWLQACQEMCFEPFGFSIMKDNGTVILTFDCYLFALNWTSKAIELGGSTYSKSFCTCLFPPNTHQNLSIVKVNLDAFLCYWG